MQKERGFTLTELLIVISIIGILAGIILISGGNVRRDARDKRRKADMEQVAGLLQIRAAQIKLTNSAQWSGVNDTSSDGDFLPILRTERYATQIPLDPLNTGANIYTSRYLQTGNGSGCPGPVFVVYARLESSSGGNSNPCSPESGANIYAVSGV